MNARASKALTLLALIGVIAMSGADVTDPQNPNSGAAKARPRAARAAVLPAVGAEPASVGAATTWRTDEILVAARPGVDLAAVAAEHGTSLRRPPGSSGYAAVLVADGQRWDGLAEALRADPRIASADRMGVIYGAGHSGSTGVDEASEGGEPRISATDLQWHLDAIDSPEVDPDELGHYLVAVLDTGVAYETYADARHSYIVAPSLASVEFASPYDFVNGDSHANDDHQHGTHIASLIASQGEVSGVAPGVSLMPVKVLDADNTGSEIDLVDAINWAVAHGADVINMSLTFGEGYAPSQALRTALADAHDAGVVMLAAAGNDAALSALYPAASPLVIGVGASTPDGEGGLAPTDYSNLSPVLDLMAPGGDLTEDRDGDGYVDGILAETIDPEDPTETGLWFYAGSSQATAIATGAVVHLLASGVVDPDEIVLDLQHGAVPHGDGFSGGTGAGHLSISGAEEAAADGAGELVEDLRVHVGMLPYLKYVSTKKVKPALQLTAVDDDGAPLKSLTLVGTWRGQSDATVFSCKTNASGTCTLKGETTVSRVGSSAEALAWGASVDAAIPKKVSKKGWNVAGRPTGAIAVSDGLILVTEALDAEGLLSSAPLGIAWDEGTDSSLGKLAASYAVIDGAVGPAVRPEALLFNPAAIDGLAEISTQTLDLDALGLSDTELGSISVSRMDLDGAGITSDPLGLTSLSLVLLRGSGITSDPLGISILSPRSMYTLSGTGITSDPLGFSGGLLLLNTGTVLGTSLDGYALETLVDTGGWLNEDGYPAASAIMSLEAVGMGSDDDAVVIVSGAVGGLIEEEAAR